MGNPDYISIGRETGYRVRTKISCIYAAVLIWSVFQESGGGSIMRPTRSSGLSPAFAKPAFC